MVWHVTTLKKIRKYTETGYIKPPVRAWKDITCVPKFSLGTGRRVIIRLNFPKNAPALPNHNGAVWLNTPYKFPIGGY